MLSALRCFTKSLFILLVALLFCVPTKAQAWVHLELGAGNYGDRSIYTTFRRKSNYDLLFKTARKLALKNQGPGLMIINDIHRGWAHIAARALQSYVRENNLDIEVWVLPGDATQIEIPPVDSIYIQNPSWHFLFDLTRPGVISKINARSRDGLTINTGYLYLEDYIDLFESLGKRTRFAVKVNPLREYVYPSGKKEGSSFRLQFEADLTAVAVDLAEVRKFPGLRKPEAPSFSWNPCEWLSRAVLMVKP